ncbi:OTU deubiquitinase with linear linkage specificity a [Chanos chanos]|uniref:OTU deubiquitinase with linear linkage specificity a n=1 Tax=Chanos chanos TaxID=29144 RepID=A0A6J2UUG8_CHACN|nr:protein YAE1 homolog [Chanos chanos]
MSWVRAVASSGEDVFDEDMDDIGLQNKEWKHNMEKRAKDGYRDGVDAGKEASLQIGFNMGYREGAVKMKSIGQLKGIVSALQCWYQSHDPGTPALSSIAELLRRVEEHEEAVIAAMRKAQERPPPSVTDVTETMEDLGMEQENECGKSGGRGRDGDGGGVCCGKNGDAGGGPTQRPSQNFNDLGESMGQLLRRCVEIVTQHGLPEELKRHLLELKAP